MAERGGQPGNSNATKNKVWIAALNRSIAQDDGERLRKAAEKLIDLAVEGNVPALKELGDRLDGRAAQAVTVSGDADNPIVTKIVRDVVKAEVT